MLPDGVSMVSCAWHYKCTGITIHLLNLMTSPNCFKWCYLTVMTSCVTSTRVLSIRRNSYCTKPCLKCLHTCDKWPELSYYKSGCSDTGFYNCVKQPATASRWITWYTVEWWSYWRWWCLWVHLSTSLGACPLKVCKMVHAIDWMFYVCLLQTHKHEWVAHARTQTDYTLSVLWSFVPIFSLTAVQLHFY